MPLIRIFLTSGLPNKLLINNDKNAGYAHVHTSFLHLYFTQSGKLG